MGLGGGAPLALPGEQQRVDSGRVTWHVVLVCLMAASGGLLFGYDLGVTGGVMQMPGFTERFFPAVAPGGAPSSPWCSYSDPLLQLFTSALFLAGMVAVLPASLLSSRCGRKASMLASGLCFAAGVGLCAGAQALAMLICGRVLLGFGVGLANQCVPIYLSEMAPARLRGSLQITFQLATTFGLLAAQLVNLGTALLHPWGWRLSIAIAGVPACVLLLGSLVLPETPASLAERGRHDEALAVLQKLRGPEADVAPELAEITAAAAACSGGTSLAGWRALFSWRYLPELLSGCAVAAFSQANGINAILFYSSAVFRGLNLGQMEALLNAAIIGGTLFLGTLVSMALVDRVGRRPLLLQGGCQMLLSLVGMAAVLAVVSKAWPASGAGPDVVLLPPAAATVVLVLMCLFVAGFSWSWGPLGWLIPSEITPLEVRSEGQALFTLVNFAVAFAGTQMFLSLLCAMTWGVYLFFAVWVVLMILYAALALPETRGVPLERMGELWQHHWLWRRVVASAGDGSRSGLASPIDAEAALSKP